MDKQINELGEIINKSNKILLINHIRMDMDAFGSMSAMYDILKQLGKNVKTINDELPLETFAFTGYNEIVEPELDVEKFDPELIISFDAASLDQLGKSYKKNINIFNNTEFVVIDHHKTNPLFGKINIVDPTYSSTCELTYDILIKIKLEKYISQKIATSLICGIYTDTNIFYNSNTTSNTHYVAGKLIELGADFRKPNFEFYKKKTFSQSKLWGEILSNNMQISDNGKIVWATIEKNIFTKTNSNERQLTGLISEFFSNIVGVEICFISHEIENNLVKTSFRSTPKYDVSFIAASLGGGGHKQAAGFSSTENLNKVETKILEKIKKEFNI